MFVRLFAESGLSLDRLRALLEVGAAGSIVKAADGDPVRQSQFSRQLKELEDFFQVKLTERNGKGIRLTPNGRELARISRFFLLGLSNFQRGCRAEEQSFRIGASATVIEHWLIPSLAKARRSQGAPRYAIECVYDDEIERRLHELTLDFGVVTKGELSRPLQRRELGEWPVELWVPKDLFATERDAQVALEQGNLPLAWPEREMAMMPGGVADVFPAALVCSSFVEARIALMERGFAALLPRFLAPEQSDFMPVKLPMGPIVIRYALVWNPRMLRLNLHAVRQRDHLADSLARLNNVCMPA